jgi:hypothetical protein
VKQISIKALPGSMLQPDTVPLFYVMTSTVCFKLPVFIYALEYCCYKLPCSHKFVAVCHLFTCIVAAFLVSNNTKVVQK